MNKGLWLVRLLMRHEGLTKNEILQAWSDEDSRGRAMPQSTFYDQRRYLQERYGIRIDCRAGRYLLRRDTKVADPLLQMFGENGSEAVSVLGPSATPVGGAHWLPLLTEAMQQFSRLQMEYAPFDKPAYTTHFAPYCLRSLRGRCYTVGYSSHHGEVRNFATDRIASLVLLPMHFRLPPDFSAEAYFRHSFGAYGGADIRPVHIVFETSARTAAYLRTKPLHATQREVASEKGCRFEMDVAPTCDLIGELLSYGEDLRVLSPDDLRRTLREKALRTAEAYSD